MNRYAWTWIGAAIALAAMPGCRIPRWNRPVPVDHPIETTPSGVMIQDELEGLGPKVTPYSEVTLDYRMTLVDMQLVDSSFDRGIPITFLMSEAPIPGWREALLGMRAGGIRTAEIPPEQGYGSEGIEGLVPPNAVLLCRFEMLEVAENRDEIDAPPAFDAVRESGVPDSDPPPLDSQP